MANVTFKGNPMTLNGTEVKVGDIAPDFTALNTDLENVTLSDFEGKIKLISVVPSLDTGVCSLQTRRFNEEVAQLENVTAITVSNDLPFAQKRFKESENLNEQAVMLSDHKDLNFGENFGTIMEELRLQARSVFVLDENNKVVHVEYVPEGTDEPNYDKAIEAIKSL